MQLKLRQRKNCNSSNSNVSVDYFAACLVFIEYKIWREKWRMWRFLVYWEGKKIQQIQYSACHKECRNHMTKTFLLLQLMAQYWEQIFCKIHEMHNLYIGLFSEMHDSFVSYINLLMTMPESCSFWKRSSFSKGLPKQQLTRRFALTDPDRTNIWWQKIVHKVPEGIKKIWRVISIIR